MRRKIIIAVVISLVLGFGAGFAVGHWVVPPAAATQGGYFCCTGYPLKPCVFSPDGDCDTPLQWCSVMREVNGTMTCAVW